jgi:hypothetical protein
MTYSRQLFSRRVDLSGIIYWGVAQPQCETYNRCAGKMVVDKMTVQVFAKRNLYCWLLNRQIQNLKFFLILLDIVTITAGKKYSKNGENNMCNMQTHIINCFSSRRPLSTVLHDLKSAGNVKFPV